MLSFQQTDLDVTAPLQYLMCYLVQLVFLPVYHPCATINQSSFDVLGANRGPADKQSMRSEICLRQQSHTAMSHANESVSIIKGEQAATKSDTAVQSACAREHGSSSRIKQ